MAQPPLHVDRYVSKVPCNRARGGNTIRIRYRIVGSEEGYDGETDLSLAEFLEHCAANRLIALTPPKTLPGEKFPYIDWFNPANVIWLRTWA